MSTEIVRYDPATRTLSTGSGSVLQYSAAVPTLTVDQMRGYLLAYLDEHPEIAGGAVLELWPDGSMAGRLGGRMSQPHWVTTIEYPDMKATRL